MDSDSHLRTNLTWPGVLNWTHETPIASNTTGGAYSLGGSIGQPDAGSLGGGSYQLNGGFWGGASINYSIYLPLALKNF